MKNRCTFAIANILQIAFQYSLFVLLTIVTVTAQGQSPRDRIVSMPSALPSGIDVNDRIWVTLTLARNPTSNPAPTLVMLHGVTDNTNMTIAAYGRYLVDHGFNTVAITLPYHGRRRPKGITNLKQVWDFAGPNLDQDVLSFRQAVSDVSTVIDWLTMPERQPHVDPNRIGFVGYSLGAIVGNIAMAKDSRISAGIAINGAGDLTEIFAHGQDFMLLRLFWHYPPANEVNRIKLAEVDPITLASTSRKPRHVFLIQAARDQVMPQSASISLWRALGRPPIEWVDTGHLGTLLMAHSEMRDAAAYLKAIWAGREPKKDEIGPIVPITLKLGFISGMGSSISPSVEWQALTLGRRSDHIGLLHLDIGATVRGPFAGIALTVTPSVDLGFGQLLTGSSRHLYLSFHTVL